MSAVLTSKTPNVQVTVYQNKLRIHCYLSVAMDFQLFETKLAKHKIFQDMKESLKNNFDNKLRNLLELKDDVLFAWNSVENCLYSVNLKRLEEDQEETPYQVQSFIFLLLYIHYSA